MEFNLPYYLGKHFRSTKYTYICIHILIVIVIHSKPSFRKTFIFIKAISSKTLFYLLVVRITNFYSNKKVLKLKIILINALKSPVCCIYIYIYVHNAQSTYNNMAHDFHHYHMHCTNNVESVNIFPKV